MPKKQSTAAKRARAAARTSGAKYTAALRHETGAHPLPPHLALFDADALDEGERMAVDCLRALVAEGQPLGVRMAEPDPEAVEDRMRAEEKGVRPQWKRWVSVEAAVDGYVLRETQYGPARSAPRRLAHLWGGTCDPSTRTAHRDETADGARVP
ncbi:hypothetical protein ACWCQ6_35860, partial [Streptomyces sp. NPDC001880]